MALTCAICNGELLHTQELRDWWNSKRIQYHVAKFQSKQAVRVLQRYSRALQQELTNGCLQRYATHIAAWVASLKWDASVQSHSLAMELLRLYLQQLEAKTTSLCPCLLSGLKFIWQKRPPCLDDPWARLEDFMPATVLAECVTLSARPQKAVCLLQKAIQIWRNEDDSQRALYVESLESELSQVQDASGDIVDAKHFRSIFRRAVAALSQPRLLLHKRKGDELELDHQDTLQRRFFARGKIYFCSLFHAKFSCECGLNAERSERGHW